MQWFSKQLRLHESYLKGASRWLTVNGPFRLKHVDDTTGGEPGQRLLLLRTRAARAAFTRYWRFAHTKICREAGSYLPFSYIRIFDLATGPVSHSSNSLDAPHVFCRQ